MRRVILIVVVFGVVALLVGGGVYWHFRQNRGTRLLEQAERAIDANNFSKAVNLAEKYISADPEGDWRGYFVLSKAYLRLGRYEEARNALDKAARIQPEEMEVLLLLADTYAFPAREVLRSPERSRRAETLEPALRDLRRANEILAGIDRGKPQVLLDAREAAAMNSVRIAAAERRLAAWHRQEADRAASARNEARHDTMLRQATAAEDRRREAARAAIEGLFSVVKEDAKRGRAAQALVELCIQEEEAQTLAAAEKIILGISDPPAMAAAMLAMHNLQGKLRGADRDVRTREIARTAEYLDKLLARHPKVAYVKLQRAGLALELSDLQTTERLCDSILAEDPRQVSARLLKANILSRRGKLAEAERVLFFLKDEFPESWQVQFAYARAALAAGKVEMARRAMRDVTRLKPTHALARKYMAETLLRGGFDAQGFEDAKAYYEAHSDDPDAIRLFVEAARRTEQAGLAREALEKAEASHADHPDILMAVAEAQKLLGDDGKHMALLRKVADTEPFSLPQKLAVARAMVLVDRVPEAGAILTAVAKAEPDDPTVQFELGRYYADTGRQMQALDYYRRAVRLSPHNAAHQLTLALALFNGTFLDEASAECEAILDYDPTNSAAALLMNRIKVAQGKPITTADIQAAGAGKGAKLAMALAHLQNGQVDRCVDLCNEVLKANPNDLEARHLLGQAYFLQGRQQQCVEQWKMLIRAEPTALPRYINVAGVLGAAKKPEEVRGELAAVPGAKPEYVDLAMAWLFHRQGAYAKAAALYQDLSARKETPEEMRGQVRLLGAESLARTGQWQRAVVELEELAKNDVWSDHALYYKAQILRAVGKFAEADGVLEALAKSAVEDKRTALLGDIASLYLEMATQGRQPQMMDRALAVADSIRGIRPNDARAYLVKARILQATGRAAEAVAEYRQAIEHQPGNIPAYLMLADALSADQKDDEAMQVLGQLPALGQAGEAASLFAQAEMLARSGLQAQAADKLEQLTKLGYAENPRLKLEMGRSLWKVGRRDRAEELLTSIPRYSAQYVEAQLFLAGNAKSAEEKLSRLDDLDKTKPGLTQSVVHRIRVLLEAGRAADAVQAFRRFAADKPANWAAPPVLADAAIRAMLLSGQTQAAAEVAVRVARAGGPRQWRAVAALLSAEDDPEVAAAMVGQLSEASLAESCLGLYLAWRAGNDTACGAWRSRVVQIDQFLAARTPPDRVPLSHLVLVDVICRDVDRAAARLAEAGKTRDVEAPEELVAYARTDAKAAAQAAQLLKAIVAHELTLRDTARRWAVALLKARPTFQWAALIAYIVDPRAKQVGEVMDLLAAKQCQLWRRLRASTLRAEGKYEEAAEMFGALSQSEGKPGPAAYNQAICLERAGKFAEALELYRKVWQASRDPASANNAAYLVSRRFPSDSRKLAEAEKLMAAAFPGDRGAQPAVLDTRGWLAHLLGKTDRALKDLRRAAKGLPAAPEVHYHLGMVEKAAGNDERSRWHLQAAIRCGKALAEAGRTLQQDQVEAIQKAREALPERERPKS